MLVLTRKADQQILIGNNIVITIVQVKGSQVKVGIEAPRDVKILRTELRRREPAEADNATVLQATATPSVGVTHVAHEPEAEPYSSPVVERAALRSTTLASRLADLRGRVPGAAHAQPSTSPCAHVGPSRLGTWGAAVAR